MANALSASIQEAIRQAFLEGGSIKAAARTTGCSRNTVRKLLRSEGLSTVSHSATVAIDLPERPKPISELDYRFLERLFELGKSNGENADFEKQIKAMVQELATELDVKSKTDILRLEGAIFQFIIYRRFYFQSLHTGDKRYSGSFERSHEKQAAAVIKWVEVSNKAFDQFNKLIRELEVNSGKRLPYWGGQNLVVTQASLKISRTEKFSD